MIIKDGEKYKPLRLTKLLYKIRNLRCKHENKQVLVYHDLENNLAILIRAETGLDHTGRCDG